VNIAKNLNLLSLCFGIGLAIHSASAGTTNALGDWVVLSSETLATNQGSLKRLAPLWNPPTNLVGEAIQRLPAYLQSAQTNGIAGHTNQLPGIQNRLPNTGCQFVGVTVELRNLEKRKGILLNCFPLSHSWSEGWKERFVKVYDGGPKWWSVVYLPDEKEFTRLRVDLGY